MPQTPSSFPRQESSPALNRRILPSVDCAFRAAPSGRYSDRRPRFPSESRPSRRFISTHPESYGHRMRTKALKALSSSPGRNLHRRSTAAFSLRSACASRCLSMNSFILPPPCGHRMRTRALKALSSSPGRSLHRRSIAAFSLRSACASRCLSMNSFVLSPPCGHRTGTRMPQTPSSFPRQESSPALNRRILSRFTLAISASRPSRRPRLLHSGRRGSSSHAGVCADNSARPCAARLSPCRG